jgi:SAM-dependent methyltransferase
MDSDGFWGNGDSVDQYYKHIHISTDDVHYAYNYPGEKLLSLLGDVEGMRTIEIGCGRGENSIALAKMGAVPHGIDMSGEMIRRARMNSRENGTGVRFQRMEAQDIGCLPRRFSAAVSAYVFDYVRDLGPVFEGAGRILLPSSVFVFSCCHPDQKPAGAAREDGTSYVEGPWPGTKENVRNYFHGKDEAIERLEACGFYVEKVIDAGRTDSSPADWPYRIEGVGRDFGIYDEMPHTMIMKAVKR